MKPSGHLGAGVTSHTWSRDGGTLSAIGPGHGQPDTCTRDPTGSFPSADTLPEEDLGKIHMLYFKINKTEILNILGLLCFTQCKELSKK